MEFSSFHALFRVLDEKEELKQQRKKQRAEGPKAGAYFNEEPLSIGRRREPKQQEPHKRQGGIFGKSAGDPLSPEQIKFCVEFGVFDRKKPVIYDRGQGLKYQQKSDLFFVYDPKTKGRIGSPYRRVEPESVLSESFLYKGDVYDIVTGRKGSQPGTVKPSPRFKRI